MKHPNNRAPLPTFNQQRGAVMAVSLVLLTALTILGVTALRSSGLHEKMAANLQEKGAAFQVAETGIVHSLGDYVEYRTTDGHTANTAKAIVISDYAGKERSDVTYNRCFSVEKNAGRQRGKPRNVNAKNFHYDILSGGKTRGSGAVATLHQGIYLPDNAAGTIGGGTLLETGNESAKVNRCMQKWNPAGV